MTTDSGSGKRGLLGAIGKKLLEVFAFPLIGLGARRPLSTLPPDGKSIIIPTGFGITPETYRSTPTRSLSAADLPSPADGPVLLLLHDAMDLTSTGFRGVSRRQR